MKRMSVIALALMLALMGAIMVQAQDTATPEPTTEPTAEATAQPTSEPTAEATAEPLPASVRFVNWSPNTAAVDIYVNDQVAAGNLAYLSATDYQTYAAGMYSFAAVEAGASTEGAITVFDMVLEEGGRYTVSAVGSTVDGTAMAVLSIDDYSPIPFGSARIYAYHAVEGLGVVDVTVDDDMVVTELGFPGTFVDLNGAINDGAFSVDVPAGTYDISFRLTEDSAVTGLDDANDDTSEDTGSEETSDTTDGETTDVPGLVNLQDFVLDAGNIYTIAIVEGDEGTGAYFTSMPGVVAPLPTALDVAMGNADFSILVAAVQAADPAIAAALAEGSLTVFAPTNAAFDAFLSDMAMTTDDLLANTDVLNAVLRYHVLGTSMTAADLGSMNGQTVASLQGEPISVTIDEAGTVTLNGSVNVIGPDIAASNGTVHIIDGVLVPPSMSSGG